jgi:hypothetical protein
MDLDLRSWNVPGRLFDSIHGSRCGRESFEPWKPMAGPKLGILRHTFLRPNEVESMSMVYS